MGYDTNPWANESPGGNGGVPVDETNTIRARAAGASQGAKRRTTMKEKPNYAELEKRIDFTALAGKLGQLTEADNPQRKTVFTLLDKVREQILEARRNRKVSYQVLARELTSAGIPVSEPTLRKYLRVQGVEKKQRKKAAPSNGNGNGKPAAAAAGAESKPAAPTRQNRFSLNT